jgi:hypothetical protein
VLKTAKNSHPSTRTHDKTDVFSTRTKNEKGGKTYFFFLSDMKFCFMKLLFPRPR